MPDYIGLQKTMEMTMTYATFADFRHDRSSGNLIKALKAFMTAWCEKSRLYGFYY